MPRHEITMLDNWFALNLFEVQARQPTADRPECFRAPEPLQHQSSNSYPDLTGATPGADACRSGRNVARLLRSSSGSTYTAWQSSFYPNLTRPLPLCYGAPLSLPLARSGRTFNYALNLSTIFGSICHELYAFRAAVWFILVFNLQGQIFTPALPLPPPPPTQVSPDVNKKVLPIRPDAPKDSEHYFVEAVEKDLGNPWRHLRGNVRIETQDMQIRADELDWNTDTSYVEARGHVHFEYYARGEKLDCDKAQYYLDDDNGDFYNVKGSAASTIQARAGLNTTTNPFYFEGQWLEKKDDTYVVHNGFLTDCTVPGPWWIFKGPTFTIVPGISAVTHNSWFYLKKVPLLYTPYFYKDLKKQPRRSGLLLPGFGTSSSHGYTGAFGYYWVINRSYDLAYNGTYYTGAGLANSVEFRGRINQNSDFDLNLFGIKTNDITQGTSDQGLHVTLKSRYDLGDGWEARGEVDYLSSLAFLQQFTTSYNEAVYGETRSVGFVTKHWGDFGVNFIAQRNVDFLTVAPPTSIEIRKLPEVDFAEREHEVKAFDWPFWVSFDSSAGLLDRTQAAFQTRNFVPRLDVGPQITTAFRWRDIQIVPTFGVRETFYGSSFEPGQPYTSPLIFGQNILRSSRSVSVDLLLPSLERIFDSPKWMGEKVKHVIEPRVTYKDVSGIDNFARLIRFDETELLSNTNQVEFSLINRLLTKDKGGTVRELLTWQLTYDRYLDPTFGGAILPNVRNVVASEIDLTGFAYLDGFRHDSPIVSDIRLQSKVNFEWRADYDVERHTLVNSSASMDGRIDQFFWTVGHTDIHTNPILFPKSDQMNVGIRYGKSNRRGWNYGGNVAYDYTQHQATYWQVQATRNTDCCGFSVRYLRLAFGTTDRSEIQFAFSVSNIGTVGTLKKQDRIF
jgi:LPS-assembly protein